MTKREAIEIVKLEVQGGSFTSTRFADDEGSKRYEIVSAHGYYGEIYFPLDVEVLPEVIVLTKV